MAAANSLRNQLTELMVCGGFNLRKWACCTGAQRFGRSIRREPGRIRDPKGNILVSDQSVGKLGLMCMPITDTHRVQFPVPPLDPDIPLTKWWNLSQIAAVYWSLPTLHINTLETQWLALAARMWYI